MVSESLPEWCAPSLWREVDVLGSLGFRVQGSGFRVQGATLIKVQTWLLRAVGF